MKKKKIFVSILMCIGFILILFGSAYAYFQYRNDTLDGIMQMGDLYFEFEDTRSITLTNVFPETVEEARSRSDNYIDFDVKSSNGIDSDIPYTVSLKYGNNYTGMTRLRDSDLAFDLSYFDGNDEIFILEDARFNNIEDLMVYSDIVNGGTTDYYRKYRLRVWVNDMVTISDTNDSSYKANNSTPYRKYYASIKINVNTIEGDTTSILYNILDDNAVSDSSIDIFNLSAASGLYTMNSTSSTDYPIKYFRGNVSNNNVIVGNYCWKIVRTTDTGGIRMIYNGLSSDNTCNTSTNHLNSGKESFSNVDARILINGSGYMYGELEVREINPTISGTSYFGDNYEYDRSVNRYKLSGNTSTVFSDVYSYTVNGDTTDYLGNKLYYLLFQSNYTTHYMVLENGMTPTDVFKKAEMNITDSNAKYIVEHWYTNAFKKYTGYLEDSVYCNDRTYQRFDNEVSGNGVQFKYGSYLRNVDRTKEFSLECPNANDRFTVSKRNGNGMLNFPVGLITFDELVLAGAVNNNGVSATYISDINQIPLTMSPLIFDYSGVCTTVLQDFSFIRAGYVRPVITLRRSTIISDGDGTINNPYIIK